MKFGKSLRNEIAETFPEWEGEFISYKDLKKQLNLIAPAWHHSTKRCRKRPRLDTENGFEAEEEEGISNLTSEEIAFMQLFDSQLDKTCIFFTEKEEEYIILCKELKDVVANLDLSGDMTQVKKALLDFHREMVLLLHYGVLNFQAVLKIAKKHKKKTGSMMGMPRVQQQPFFTTNMLYILLEECEVMLTQLFLP